MKTNNQIRKIAIIIFLVLNSLPLYAQTVLYQDFDSGIGNWWVDNGLWEVGIPTVGPSTCHTGSNCAGTVLGGNYPPNANTRLISPNIILPSLSSGEYIKLKFWHWFRMNVDDLWGNDQGYVQISVKGGAWHTIARPIEGYSPAWTQGYVDLSAYADSTVRIAFYFYSNGALNDNGWYIDDISISKGVPIFNNPETFEFGIGDWNADNGLWEVGTPTVGPDSAHSGQNCIGTILGGNYPNNANTRLISPQITLVPQQGNFVELYYWHWFRMNEDNLWGNDQGYVQISVKGGPWQTLAGPIEGYSPVWTQRYVDLSAYADSTVRIAFYFISNGALNDNGWYIDDVRITNLSTDVDNPSWESKVFKSFALDQNYPNPFNRSTTIHFEIPKESYVKLIVYNMLGQKVMNVVDEEKPAGRYDVSLDGSSLPSGVYFYRLFAGEFTSTKKFILLK